METIHPAVLGICILAHGQAHVGEMGTHDQANIVRMGKEPWCRPNTRLDNSIDLQMEKNLSSRFRDTCMHSATGIRFDTILAQGQALMWQVANDLPLHKYWSRQSHRSSNSVNSCNGFRDIYPAKFEPYRYHIWHVFAPWATPYGVNEHAITHLQSGKFHRITNGENPSSGFRVLKSGTLAHSPPARPERYDNNNNNPNNPWLYVPLLRTGFAASDKGKWPTGYKAFATSFLRNNDVLVLKGIVFNAHIFWQDRSRTPKNPRSPYFLNSQHDWPLWQQSQVMYVVCTWSNKDLLFVSCPKSR